MDVFVDVVMLAVILVFVGIPLHAVRDETSSFPMEFLATIAPGVVLLAAINVAVPAVITMETLISIVASAVLLTIVGIAPDAARRK